MKHAEAPPVRSDINVTPLVDVVLVLLIIFMVVTPMLQRGPAVKLPLADEPPQKPDDASQIVVAVDRDGRVWLGRDPLDASAFSERIREDFQRNPGSSVVVKGDARLEFGSVKRILLDVREAGFKDVGLIAEKPQRVR